jgi:hypothetical protein
MLHRLSILVVFMSLMFLSGYFTLASDDAHVPPSMALRAYDRAFSHYARSAAA